MPVAAAKAPASQILRTGFCRSSKLAGKNEKGLRRGKKGALINDLATPFFSDFSKSSPATEPVSGDWLPFGYQNRKTQRHLESKKPRNRHGYGASLRADEEIRTLDPLLGKEVFYH